MAVRLEVVDVVRRDAATVEDRDVLRDRIAPGGTFVVIAYHSGEDRIVKNVFRDWSAACICPPKQPFCTCRGAPLGTLLTRKAVVASDDETRRNPRARSARLRGFRNAG